MSAFASITVQELTKFNEFSHEKAFTSFSEALASNGASPATFGGYFKMSSSDGKYLILIQNTASSGNAKTVAVKAGNALQGVADIIKSDLGAGQYTLVSLESGRFKNVYDNPMLTRLSSSVASEQISARGNVFITGADADIKVAVFRLP